MKKRIILLFLILLSKNISYSQVSKEGVKMAKAIEGFDKPEYLVTYEIIPSKSNECNIPINTLIFEIPVTEDYFSSVEKNQEVSSWFKTNEGLVLMGSFPSGLDNKRWKLVVRNKKIISKGSSN